MHFLKNKKIKIPYLVSILFPTGVWAFLCAAFAVFLILSRGNFEATRDRVIFAVATPLAMVLIILIGFVEFGLLRIIGIKKEKEHIKILNDNIVNGNLPSGLPTETVKKIFYALIKQPKEGIKAGNKYGFMIISAALLIEWMASRQFVNFPIIIISGLISYFIAVLFGSSVAEKLIYPLVKQCRITLAERGEEIEEPPFLGLKTKFNYFLLISGLVIAAIFSFIPSINLDMVIFSCIGIIMVIIVNSELSSSIYIAFQEVEDFAKKLPKGEKVVFSTGSLNREIVSLSKSLNRAASEIYTSKQELEKNYKDLKERKDELERFYNLTVGRELKMIELKEELKKMKELENGEK